MSTQLQPQESPASALARPTLAARFKAIRALTEELAAPLSPEDQMVQSCAEASPVKWHRAHTTWFFETFLLQPHLKNYKCFDPAFRYLFNSYYNRVGEKPERNTRSFISRPSAQEVAGYRKHVNENMSQLLSSSDVSAELANLVELGLNHEQQHQELIVTDIKHALWSNPLRPQYRAANSKSRSANESVPLVPLHWIPFDGGICEIGHSGEGFCFDNELPRHKFFLQPYMLASRLVSNGEFLEFINDGGYQRPELWLSDGWEQCRAASWRAPLYWEQREGEWHTFTLDGMRPLAMHEPVCHVSYFEADAFARWSQARLPTEFEWEIAARNLPLTGNFLDSQRLHPAAAHGAALTQIFGDAWQWTASQYTAYPGYHAAEGALGEYNGKFMCNQFVLRGGSCATPQSHIRASYRNFFPPAARWQFSGIRLAK